MTYRSMASGTISFGLVSVPVKFYLAASSEDVHLNNLCPNSNAKAQQKLWDPILNEEIPRGEEVKGYEYAKGNFVRFSKEELQAIQGDNSNSISIKEFVSISNIDFIQIEKSYYLGPNKGADKAYKLLSQIMTSKNLVAIGQWNTRGKEHLIVIRPYNDGLVVHQIFYKNEVRAFESGCANVNITDNEINLAQKLVDQMTSDTLDLSKYYDSSVQKFHEIIERKVNGREIETLTVGPAAATVVDLIGALKDSLEKSSKKSSKSKRRKSKKKAS